jgi:hypothetical protein
MKTLGEKGIDTDKIFEEIKQTCAKALVAI